jgi:transglutaminase-like putative cysteine protease
MRIRAGYEISYDCTQPTPMMMALSVHPSRFPDLLTPDRMRLDPPIRANTYHDAFGNFCHVIRAPAGRLTLSADFLVQDSGTPDEVAPGAPQHSLETLPVETLVYLLGSRYCETDRLSNTAWSLFEKVPKGWPLVKAICDYVHDRITFGYQHASPSTTVSKYRDCQSASKPNIRVDRRESRVRTVPLVPTAVPAEPPGPGTCSRIARWHEPDDHRRTRRAMMC